MILEKIGLPLFGSNPKLPHSLLSCPSLLSAVQQTNLPSISALRTHSLPSPTNLMRSAKSSSLCSKIHSFHLRKLDVGQHSNWRCLCHFYLFIAFCSSIQAPKSFCLEACSDTTFVGWKSSSCVYEIKMKVQVFLWYIDLQKTCWKEKQGREFLLFILWISLASLFIPATLQAYKHVFYIIYKLTCP